MSSEFYRQYIGNVMSQAMKPLLSALTELYSDLPEMQIKSNGIIYHYTSADTLPYIMLKSGVKLRFTDYRFLNDTSEGKEVPNLFNSVLDDLLQNNKIDQEFCSEVKRQYEKHTLPQMLVACFSQESDLLPMWNYYLKNGKFEGYNLGFSFPEYDLNSGLMKAKVIYEDKEKERIIRSIIVKYAENEGTISEKCEKLIQKIHFLALVMKNKCFSHEKEIRLILNYDMASHIQDNSNLGLTFEKIKFRSKNGILQPYCDVEFSDKSIVQSCCVAPTLNYSLSQLGITTFLESNEYDLSQISLNQSELPVRF